MKWKLISADKETDHPFLNFYTLHYQVEKNGNSYPVDYYLSSRHNPDSLLAKTHDFSKPDGVRRLLYSLDASTSAYSLLLEKQFRPAVGSYLYSIPAGLMEKSDRDIAETAIRESREETGARLKNVVPLVFPSPSSTGLSDETLSLVKGEIVSFGNTDKEPFEDIGCFLYPIDKIKERLKDPSKYPFSFTARLCIRYFLQSLEN